MRSPGSPEELPTPWELWVRVAAMAALERAIPYDGSTSFSVHARGATHDDGGGNVWTLRLIEGGRAVLHGCDHEVSATRLLKPPLDLLAGAPEWLPLAMLDSLQRGLELGFVYWYDGRWDRVAYPAEVRDDGIASTVGRVVSLDALVQNAANVLLGYRLGETLDEDADDYDEAEQDLDSTIERALGGALEEMIRQARERELSAASFAWLGDRWDLDIDAALRLAHQAGLTPEGHIPQAPPG